MIERRELPTYPAGAKDKVQPKAWFSEDIMLEWVTEILAPYVATAPPGVVPLLYLDSFPVHMMGSVVGAIQALGELFRYYGRSDLAAAALARAREESNTRPRGSTPTTPAASSQRGHSSLR